VNKGTGRNSLFGPTPEENTTIENTGRLMDAAMPQQRLKKTAGLSNIEHLVVAVVKKYPAHTDDQIKQLLTSRET
jgi:hypothetical protein